VNAVNKIITWKPEELIMTVSMDGDKEEITWPKNY
jgi:hypothetical protein